MSVQFAITAAETPAANGHGETHSTAGFKVLTLGSIGVVYGDIGTSPLYALPRSGRCRRRPAAHSGEASRVRRPVADPLGADPRRDAQIRPHPAARRQQRRGRHAGADGAGATRLGQGCSSIMLLGMIAAALFYGDAMITPALSVLSAVEGLKVVHRRLRTLCRAADACHPGRPVRRPVARHRARGRLFRADHARSGSSLIAVCGRARTSPTIPRCCWRSIRSTGSASWPVTA